jgi:hypothetical protein
MINKCMRARFLWIAILAASAIGLAISCSNTKNDEANNLADPIVGTWKLNITKSKIAIPDSTPKEIIEYYSAMKEWTEIYREIEGDQMELASTEEPAGKYVWPRQGGVVKVVEGDPLLATHIETLIEPGNWYVTLLIDGRQVAVKHKTFSKDGKTMLMKETFRDPQGKFIEMPFVFDKQ